MGVARHEHCTVPTYAPAKLVLMVEIELTTARRFQSTHPRRVRPSGVRVGTTIDDQFQSTHPRRVRLGSTETSSSDPPRFNPRTRAGCDHGGGAGAGGHVQVSIHAPAQGATVSHTATSATCACFNPRTRAGCDAPCHPGSMCPARFQSTHPRRVRHANQSSVIQVDVFQSTHPRRVRRRRDSVQVGGCVVSIHAPAQGATLAFPSSPPRETRRFNPRTRAGCDGSHSEKSSGLSSFNPRTRAGCDPQRRAAARWQGWSFNPRTRAGCDVEPEKPDGSLELFQSTHPRRVRLEVDYIRANNGGVSIHAPAQGATAA